MLYHVVENARIMPMAKKVDINGYWDIKANPLTKEGVFAYLGKQIDPRGERWGLDQERIYWVYRPRSEIAKEETMKSFDGVPFIDEHDMLGEGCTPTDMKNIAGTVYNVRMSGDKMVGDFKIYSDSMKKEIREGKKELSLGYRAEFKKRSGIFNGKSYDFVQVGIVGNHVALVARGRCGSDVRIFDKSIVCDSMEIPKMVIDKEALKAILDGMDDATLAKADELLKKLTVKDGCSEDGCTEDEEAKKKAEEEAKKKAEDEAAAKKAAEDEAAKKAAEDEAAKKKEAEDEAIKKAVHDEAIKSYKEAVALHDQLVPHIGEFVMDGMDTVQAVAEYGCKKLELNVNAGSEIATLTGFLAGCKGNKAEKVVTTDEAATPTAKFDFKAAYLAK